MTHLNNGGSVWSADYIALHDQLARLHFSLGVYRDWFVAHHRVTPLIPVISHEGAAMGLMPETSASRDAASNAAGATRLASVFPGMDDTPLHQTFDRRILAAFEALPDLDAEDRKVVREVIEGRSVMSPDVVGVASAVAAGVESIYSVAPKTPPA